MTRRIFGICVAFEILAAWPLSFWLMWHFAFRSDAAAVWGRNALIPLVLILPIVIAVTAYRKEMKR
jgi:hypothetical protein